MTARHLTYVAIFGAAVIVVVSFALSAGAVIDHAQDIGVDPRLAQALPICVEALIVVAAAVRIARRIDAELAQAADDTDRRDGKAPLATCVFYGGVAITVAINWAHGGPDPVAAFLSALPALSLPAALHLALEEWLRVRTQAKPAKPARGKRKKKTAPPPAAPAKRVAKPAAVEATTSGPPSNGAKPRPLGKDEVAERLPTQADVDAWLAEHGSFRAASDALPTHRTTLQRHIDDLQARVS